MLANRLEKVVSKMVSKYQNAFMRGRQILDAVFIAKEVIDSISKSNDCSVLCKLDIHNAYGHVY